MLVSPQLENQLTQPWYQEEVWIRLLSLLEMDRYTARKNVNTFPVGRKDNLFLKGPFKNAFLNLFQSLLL